MNSKILAFSLLLALTGFITPSQAQEGMIGEIRLFGGNFAPRGWMDCEGQLLPINNNQALFSILGTTYGGDGRTTFALPDLRGLSTNADGIQNKSTPSGSEMTVTFNNQTNKKLAIHKVDRNGNRKRVGSLSKQGPSTFKSKNGEVYRFYNNSEEVANLVVKSGTTSYNVSLGMNSDPGPRIRYIMCTQGIFPSRS